MTGVSYRGARVLVTGASGFLGRHLLTRLLAEGARVMAIAIEAEDAWAAPRGVSVACADVAAAAALTRLLRDRPFDVVVHLAADTDNSRDPKDPARILRTNVTGTLNLLRAVEKSGYRSAVLASTAEVYGDGSPPFREDARRRPLSAYAASKSIAEDLALSYQRSMGWPVSIARIFQPYGPGQRGRFFVSSLLEALLDGRTLEMTAGEQSRDFVYVEDVGEALLRLGARPDLAGRIFNVGSGTETRLVDLVDLAVSLVPNAPRPRLGALPYRAAEVMRQIADVSALESALRWKPSTPLEWGLRLTIEAIRRDRDAARRRATGS